MDKISSSLINFFAYVSVCFLAVFCLSSGVAEAQEKSYSDCAYIEFDDVEPSTLTLQERIALEEAALFASLDDSAECMEEATASASGSLADAASGSGSGAAGGASGRLVARVIAKQTRVSSNNNLHLRHRKLRWRQRSSAWQHG